MIVDQALYRQGRRFECGDLSDELATLRDGAEGFIWIGLKDPTDEEFELVRHELGLHPLAVEDAVMGNQRAKIEQYEGSLFVVLKTLRYIDETSDIETGEVMLFIGDRFVVTVRHGEGNPLADVREQLEQHPELLEHGPLIVMHAVMDSVVDHYVDVDRELGIDLDEIEAQVVGDDGVGNANSIYRLKREVLEFRRASGPLADSLAGFLDRGDGELHVDLRHLFRDVADHLRHVNDHIESYDRLLTVILSAHLASVSVQQNSDMRKISAWVAIAAVPTMIAGIYGMNFDGMPELDASVNVGGAEYYYGYFVVLGVIVGVCLYLWTRFKRSGWL
ncbi:magnesium and cobalt transport protein CorA [Intrasporangium sp.]|uniref:magnesium and cobalt transport protein CorA n=1 Tax=Intrasporangium sp. TaxID=1925024 RepID=UPI00336555A5